MIRADLDWADIDAAFDRALDLEGGERAAFLDSMPETLRGAVATLLDATGADDPLSRDVGEVAGRLLEAADRALDARAVDQVAAGRRLGPWRVLERLGAGGMGVVYLAERADAAYEQQVALKVIRWELADGALVDRFLAERQILARLDHPHIASLIDGGMTDGGLPYLVLERVEGRPIDVYCAEEELDLRARVRLLSTVCRAVDHAHRRLVVHRDLKPSNLLVRDDGMPKLLDFGVAKLLDSVESDLTRVVAPLTPRYAAPEQRRGEPVTVAADVWALGTLLDELVDGSEAASERRARSSDLRNIVRQARRDEPEHRYRTAGDLADDLERWLAGRPVEATPPTVRYRVGTWVRRHRATAAALALAATSVLGGVVGVVWQADEARRERDEARRQLLRAEQVTAFLRTLFESAMPRLGEEPSVRDLLDRGAETVDDEMADAPLVRAELLTTLGQSYRWLGDTERAEELIRESLSLVETHDSGSADHAMVLASLGNVVRENGDAESGEAYYDAALEQLDAAGVQADARRASIYNSKGSARMDAGDYDAALEWLHRSIEMYESLGSDAVAQAYGNLGGTLGELGRLQEAERAHRRALEIYLRSDPENTSRAVVLNNLALNLASQGRVDEAIETIDEVASLRRTPGQEAAQATTATNLAYLLLLEGRAGDAARFAARAVETFEATEPESFELIAAKANLGWALALAMETERALELLRSVERDLLATLADDHPLVARARGRVGAVVLRSGRASEAETLLESALATLGDSGERVMRADIEAPLAASLCAAGDRARSPEPTERALERGLDLARSSLAVYASTYGSDHWTTAAAHVEEARCLAALERRWDREELVAAREILRGRRGPDAWSTRRAEALLATD